MGGCFISDCSGFGEQQLASVQEDRIEIIGNIHQQKNK
jgi:hypothetical protein